MPLHRLAALALAATLLAGCTGGVATSSSPSSASESVAASASAGGSVTASAEPVPSSAEPVPSDALGALAATSPWSSPRRFRAP